MEMRLKSILRRPGRFLLGGGVISASVTKEGIRAEEVQQDPRDKKTSDSSAVLAQMESCFEDLRSKMFQCEKGGLLREIRTKRVQMWLKGRLKKTDVELNGFGPRVMNFLKTLSTPDLFANRG